MKLGTANPDRHWHHWDPLDNDVRTVKTCKECGRRKRWNGKKWITMPPLRK